MEAAYHRLARFLDELPAGYPATESGIELRILQRLFTPEDAMLFVHLSLLNESPRVIAYRAQQPLEAVTAMLEEMERKGLVSASRKPGKPAEFAANQFVVGFMEDQVNHLDRELAEMLEIYLPEFFKRGPWFKLPQLRTIPVGESIPLQTDVMPYERAEEIVRSHTDFAVRNCVCRQERQALGKGCDKPLEMCLSFDSGARYTAFTGRGRLISMDEALALLKQADQAGLVLQPANSKDPVFICACCGCCCGVLRGLKMQPKPASLVANPFIASLDAAACSSCATCTERCQMGAISLGAVSAELDLDRCIGCGLCVSTCPSGALSLVRKPASEQPSIPKNTLHTYLQLSQARENGGPGKLAEMMLKSKLDRLMAPK